MNIKREKTLDDFIYMEQLELKYYSEEHVTPHEEAYRWHLSNPDTGFVLEDGGRIVAFTDILPVKPERFEQIVGGTLDDKYLTPDDLVSMDELKEGDSLDLLLSCVLVDDGYRETDALKILLSAHLDYYRSFETKGARIGTVITSNVTRAGEHFSERMGFERIGRSDHQTTLYRTSFRKLAEQVRLMRPRLEQKLLQYEKNLLDHEFCRNADSLDALIAQDFIEYGQSGRIYDRKGAIRSLLSSDRSDTELRDFTVRCLCGHVAEVHYVAARKSVEPWDGCGESESLRTSIWIRDGEGWKLHFHQGTRLK